MFHEMKSSIPLNLLIPDVFEELFDILESYRHNKREWNAFMNQVNEGGACTHRRDIEFMFPTYSTSGHDE